jgi:hypothetical protein
VPRGNQLARQWQLPYSSIPKRLDTSRVESRELTVAETAKQRRDQRWQMADTLRGGMDAAEYKHVVLGPIFLKYISDAFEGQRGKL